MQGFGAFGQFGEIAILQEFGERVEQALHVAFLEGVMPWLAPFVQDGWDEAVAADADIGGADDQVMRLGIGDPGFFEGGNAFVLIMPLAHEQSDGALHQLRQVADDEPGVFAREFDLAAE